MLREPNFILYLLSINYTCYLNKIYTQRSIGRVPELTRPYLNKARTKLNAKAYIAFMSDHLYYERQIKAGRLRLHRLRRKFAAEPNLI